jgi:hypothetical protein
MAQDFTSWEERGRTLQNWIEDGRKSECPYTKSTFSLTCHVIVTSKSSSSNRNRKFLKSHCVMLSRVSAKPTPPFNTSRLQSALFASKQFSVRVENNSAKARIRVGFLAVITSLPCTGSTEVADFGFHADYHNSLDVKAKWAVVIENQV